MGNATSDLSQDIFDRFLTALDPDHERAGRKYEQVRGRLVRFFALNGCASPEDLTDETINRVVANIGKMEEIDNISLYFYAVARNLLKESLKRSPRQMDELPEEVTEQYGNVESEHMCLDQCLAKLPSQDVALILRYYEKTGSAKLDHRRELAKELGISLNALRIRSHRIRLTLGECVTRCLQKEL